MKLRLRCLETKETRKLELPDSCSFEQLSQALCDISSLSPPLHFSLNRKDELRALSPNDSLRSVSIAPGDLVYYSCDPNAFISPSLGQDSAPPNNLDRRDANVGSKAEQENGTPRDLSKEADSARGSSDLSTNASNKRGRSPDLGVERQAECSWQTNSAARDEEITTEEDMETGEMDYGAAEVAAGKRLVEPHFLKKFPRDGLGDDRNQYELLVMAVHAVLLESGFVLFDNISGTPADKISLGDGRHSVSLCYTLPELVGNESHRTETLAIKFQNIGHLVNAYGTIGKGATVRGIYLDKSKFSPSLELVWPRCFENDLKDDKGMSSSLYADILQLWKIVKDGLVLPLLIDLCDQTGLSPPPCWMRLPSELKLKVLEHLRGVDIAKMACVCSELRYLASNNDLWKQKCLEEFANVLEVQSVVCWKTNYVSSWRRRAMVFYHPSWRASRPYFYPIRRDPIPFGIPQMIGGDYDRLPGLRIPLSGRQRGPPAYHRFISMRDFSPCCNHGGFDA